MVTTAKPASAAASITNVAALANVSTATVSRVLSGKRTKDDDIARRVRAAAEELNYSVNYAASALRSDVTNTIGLLIPSATDPLSAQLLDELEPMIDVDAQQLLLGIGATRELQAERLESLTARNVDGLIVIPAPGTDPTDTLERFARHTPIVQVGGRQSSFRTSMVSIDENAAMEASVRHLAESGARSVAYLAGKDVSFESAELFAMFHTQVRSRTLFTRNEWSQFGERTVQRGFHCAMRLFGDALDRSGRDDLYRLRPEALICCDDAVAFGAMIALDALDLRVPQDVRIVGYGDSPLAMTTMPQLTSLRPPVQQIVAEALRLIAAGPATPAHIMLPPQLIIRGSSRAA
ncbi:LacI family transcriptional regulator [Bifidobacterium ramosum]|uniref:LacI family DNA-binding transcriptional regulator n=1 Tax=Bifidobacterium ramosum TaxID=1798158 RepID=A0A6L4X1Y8_9BIFI|nr:LacI family DNA-binding transcriptional regulator [Bifidobacterium ramosum]KAB8288353.1 LacI family transcriptional regulator [Bifidobacterium ramosum]NEG71610.1 LacI family DNA-binding transcriptional regulator [Bifidobacterium ramosum]